MVVSLNVRRVSEVVLQSHELTLPLGHEDLLGLDILHDVGNQLLLTSRFQ